MERDRCIQCGAPTERGHRYCRDHLKAVLDQARDRTRRNLEATREPRGSDFSS
jgi:predicted nucleic acid-binding Zn ribbon protein